MKRIVKISYIVEYKRRKNQIYSVLEQYRSREQAIARVGIEMKNDLDFGIDTFDYRIRKVEKVIYND